MVLLGKAIDVDNETRICPRLKENMISGEFLSAEDANKIILTRDSAEKLNLKIGDALVLFAVSHKGAINATELILKGLFEPPFPDSNKKLGYLPLKTAQNLLLMDGMVTEIVVKKDANFDTVKLVGELRNEFAGQQLEINTWREIELIII